jgi:DNA (cytosine-5)-methyltransferase 1
MLTAATMFSGIGAPETAMPHWRWPWHAEIEKFPSAVLEERHPDSINIGDVSAHDFCDRAADAGKPDVLVFGSPCQAFSIAGKRLGLDDARGNLALVALGIVARLKPDWFVFENVPGLLSSGEGRDFGAFVGTVDELGYFGAWASLDAQWFGVAQRRERLFFVGRAGDWRGPAAVLLEPSSLCGYSPPSRQTGQRIADSLTVGANQYSGFCGEPVASTLTRTYAEQSGQDMAQDGLLIAHALRGEGFDASEDGTGRGTPIVVGTLTSNGDAHSGFKDERGLVPVAFGAQMSTPHWQPKAMAQGSAVRRLTPRECERLQGFPDDYTLIQYRGKPAADGPRYKALGNSMAVPVMRWILSRIEMANVQ